jgi:hypothetical protein
MLLVAVFAPTRRRWLRRKAEEWGVHPDNLAA